MRVRGDIAVGATLVAILVTGCGSSSHSSSSSASTTTSSSAYATSTTVARAITKTAFVARANAICSASNAELGKAAQQTFGNQQPSETTWRPFMVAKVLPLVEARIRAIQALGSPQGDTDKIKAIVDAGLTAVNSARQHPQLLSPNSRAPFENFDQLVAAYGLPSCAVGS